MKKNLPVSLITALFLSVSLATSFAQASGLSPLAISVIPPVQFPPSGFDVVGARVSVLWGEHREVYGIDVGALGNMTDVDFGGIAVAGGFNYNKGTSTIVGLQLAGITNINVNKNRVVGAQIAGLVNSNQAESSIVGVDLALINNTPYTTVSGVQLGIYNHSRVVNGFQIGLINRVESLHGLQIGLANFNHTGLFAFSPIVNVGF